jgi:hypothetical protein
MSSVFSSSTEFLPNLPGYRPKEYRATAKREMFRIIDGSVFPKEINPVPLLRSGGINEEASLMSIGTSMSMMARPHSRVNVESVNLVLTFNCYFIHNDVVDQRFNGTRKCNIYYYVEDGTLSIIERPTENSGLSQGTLVKRSIVFNADGTQITVDDFQIGGVITIFGIDYRIVDCDSATRKYLQRSYGADEALALTNVRSDSSLLDKEKNPTDEWGRFRSKKNSNKTFMEAQLGNTVNNKGREGFIRYGNKTLKFLCVWDNTSMLYGDRLEFSLVYYLADDTVEIFSLPSGGNKDQFSRLLKRGKLPKFFDFKGIGEDAGVAGSTPSFYHWSDICIGLEIDVYARKLRIVDADRSTRSFYEEYGDPLGSPEVEEKPAVTVHQREIPPPTGFGSEEDSLRSCSGPLQPGPPPIKKMGENKVLTFLASLLTGGPDDVDRRFIITYYVQDQTIKVQEPPVRNSGFVGGVFLSRRQIKNEYGELLTERSLYVGCDVQVLRHRFRLLEASEGTLRWMEDKGLPKSSFYVVLDKIRHVLISDASRGSLAEAFRALETDGKNGKDLATKEALGKVLESFGLLGDRADQLSEHELLTIVRANGNKSNKFNYIKFIEQIISPTDEYK